MTRAITRAMTLSTTLAATCTQSCLVLRGRPRFQLLRWAFGSLLGLCLLTPAWAAHPTDAKKSLRIYFVDVEGGQATLFVTPKGQSLLIDTGWPGNEGRDADRVVAAAKNAGISKIDYVLVTHFHNDHVGGAPQLAARVPVGTFIDHGENRESTDASTVQVWQAYQQLLARGKYKRMTAKPGDTLPIRGMRAIIVSSDGAVLKAIRCPRLGRRIQIARMPNPIPPIRQRICARWEHSLRLAS